MHWWSGLVGREDVLEAFATQYLTTRPVPSADGLALLGIDTEECNSHFGRHDIDEEDSWEYLTPELIAALCRASEQGPLVYFETRYFGGAGNQGGAAFAGGEMVFRSNYGPFGQINQALGYLGVEPKVGDAFDAVGISEYRSLDALYPERE